MANSICASSTTVLRLKRKRNEPCSDSLLISCKKKRKGCDDAHTHELGQKCVKLAGTVRSKDSTELYSLSTLNEQSTSETSPISISSTTLCKGNKRVCQISNEPVQLEEVGSTEAKRRLTVYDITKSSNTEQVSTDNKITCNGHVMEHNVNPFGKKEDMSIDKYGEDEDDYVYDIFYTDSDVVAEDVDDILCVEAFSENYGFLKHDFRECYEDDDDSNEESNWRNDYPDELDSSESSEYADVVAYGHIDPAGLFAINSNLSNKCQLASDEDDDDSIGYEKSYHSYKKALAREFKLTESSSEYDSDSFS